VTLKPGLQATLRHTVAEADTAAALGSGEEPVLATSRVLALAEQAMVPWLPGRSRRARDYGRQPRRAGPSGPDPGRAELEVRAVLKRVARRRPKFAARLRKGDRPVASSLITRVVVETAAFLRDAGSNGGAAG